MRSLGWVRGTYGCFALAAVLAALLAPVPAASQTQVERETRVALEPSGRLFEIDRVLARRLGLFLEAYPDFQTARLYQTSADAFVLEVTVGDGGRRRVPMTPDEVEVLRRDVADRMARAAPERLVDQEGRPRLLAGATALGLGFYGWAAPATFEADDPNTAIGLYMVVSASSFALPFMATQRATVTMADADLALYGASRGIAHGVFLREALDPHHDIDTGQVLGMAMVASIAEGTAFYSWSRSSELEPGVTRTMGTLGDYGMLSTIGLVSVATPGGLPRTSMGWSALCGSAAGVAAGRMFAAGRGFSGGDAGVMRTATLVGAFTGASIGDLARGGGGPDDPWIIGAITGGGIAFVAGNGLVAGHDFTEGQSRMVAYGTGAGALLGLGLAFLTVDEEDAGGVITAGGAVLGFALVYSALRDDALAADAEGSGTNAHGSRLAWSINPVAAAALASPHAPGHDAPIVQVRYVFGGAVAQP